jgi:hypothetical protein
MIGGKQIIGGFAQAIGGNGEMVCKQGWIASDIGYRISKPGGKKRLKEALVGPKRVCGLKRGPKIEYPKDEERHAQRVRKGRGR